MEKGKENTLLQSLQLDEVIPSPQNDPIENNHLLLMIITTKTIRPGFQ